MKTLSVMFAGVFIIWAYFSCTTPKVDNQRRYSNSEQVTAIVDEKASAGLDLEALIPLIKEVENAEELEKRLNAKGGLNNLDLNNDQKVDFLKVTEFGSKDAYGFSLTAFPADGQEQEVATIEIQREDKEAAVQVSGNSQLYGQNHHHYHSRFGVTDWLLLGYLMRPNPIYYAPRWGFGHYPSYYGGYRTVPYGSYHSRASSYNTGFWSRQGGNGVRRSSQPMKTGLVSPNRNKSATTGIRKSLSNPSSAQKGFRTREASKAVKSGGFGRKTSTSTRSRGRSTSSRSFGGRGK